MKTGQYALPLHLAKMGQWHDIHSSDYSGNAEATKKVNAIIELEGSYDDMQHFFQTLPLSLKIKSCRNGRH